MVASIGFPKFLDLNFPHQRYFLRSMRRWKRPSPPTLCLLTKALRLSENRMRSEPSTHPEVPLFGLLAAQVAMLEREQSEPHIRARDNLQTHKCSYHSQK